MTARPRLHRAAISRREALLFEAGVKLGGAFHQYIGTPVTPATAGGLSRTIERAISLQPFVTHVRVTIDPRRGGKAGRGLFGYRYLSAEMLRIDVTLRDGPVKVHARLAHRPDLRYPLMSVERVTGSRDPIPSRRRRTPAGIGR